MKALKKRGRKWFDGGGEISFYLGPFYGIQFGCNVDFGLGEGNYRLPVDTTSSDFSNVAGTKYEGFHPETLPLPGFMGDKARFAGVGATVFASPLIMRITSCTYPKASCPVRS